MVVNIRNYQLPILIPLISTNFAAIDCTQKPYTYFAPQNPTYFDIKNLYVNTGFVLRICLIEKKKLCQNLLLEEHVHPFLVG